MTHSGVLVLKYHNILFSYWPENIMPVPLVQLNIGHQDYHSKYTQVNFWLVILSCTEAGVTVLGWHFGHLKFWRYSEFYIVSLHPLHDTLTRLATMVI
jgi:hypothetical protein